MAPNWRPAWSEPSLEAGPHGVTINCVCPAFVRTPLVEGQLADLAVLSADYFSVPEEDIKGIESVLTA
jgi:NAD(P)-dependent dehydrogenase (short-subunit alcohol dehydrogenase family)